jgi:hypothetical protein
MIDRAAVLKRVTNECRAVHDPCTWENLSALMTPDEVAAFKGGVEIESSTSDGPADFEPPEPAVVDVADVSHVVRPENPYEAMRAAEQALNDARQELRDRRNAVQASRVAFGKALEDWNRGAPVATHEQAARQFIAASNADRVARAAAGQGIWHPGITRTAKALAGGNQKAGGGAAYRRGAYTKAQALTAESNRLRAAALAAKTPR